MHSKVEAKMGRQTSLMNAKRTCNRAVNYLTNHENPATKEKEELPDYYRTVFIELSNFEEVLDKALVAQEILKQPKKSAAECVHPTIKHIHTCYVYSLSYLVYSHGPTCSDPSAFIQLANAHVLFPLSLPQAKL